jgi:hypothetical protein
MERLTEDRYNRIQNRNVVWMIVLTPFILWELWVIIWFIFGP